MSAIQWTDETWNWLVDCSRVSPGCAHCYAADAAKSARLQQFPQYQTVKDWDGTVEFVESQLDKPLKRRKPTRYFTCSMSDVFHESVPFEWIDRAFAVMALTPQHTYQVLTKRPERMLRYLTSEGRAQNIAVAVTWLTVSPSQIYKGYQSAFPLPNVWLGVTVENQKAADERIPLLLQTPAAVRFLSCEPLLEEIDIASYLKAHEWNDDFSATHSVIDWAIIGGESGSKARPFHLSWARSLIQQCKDAGVAVFVKQLGSHYVTASGVHWQCGSRKNGDPEGWEEDLRVRQFPNVHQPE